MYLRGYSADGGAHRSEIEKSHLLVFFRKMISIYEDLCALPIRRIDSPREINEAEKMGMDAGPARSEISRDFEIFLSPRLLRTERAYLKFGWRLALKRGRSPNENR